ncbi:MAG: efflux RND transporter permease subunit, partial [Pseudomonadales bacterium]
VLGIVVDDAVVVGENIVAEQESGRPGVLGSIAGVRGVQGPVLVGVLTTIAAFAPLLLATGTFASVLGILPVVVIAVLTISLIEVFFILPSHLSHTGTWSRGALASIQTRAAALVTRFRDDWLVPLIVRAAQRRLLTVFIGFGVLFLSISLVVTGAVRFIFFPSLSSDTISASLEMPIGTPYNVTRETAERLLVAAKAVNDELDGSVFESVNATIGGRLLSGGGPGGRSGMTTSSHSATIRIQLVPESGRTLNAVQLEKLWRDEVGPVPGVESLTYSAQFFDRGPEIDYQLSHPNDRVLEQAAQTLKQLVAEIPAATEVQDTYALGKRQFDITLTPAGEAAGLLPADIARQLRQSFFGEEVQRIQRGREELKVMVRYPLAKRRSTLDLSGTRIRLADGSMAPISAVAELTESRSYSEIDRIDGRRVVSVTAKVDTTIATPDQANGVIQQEFVPKLRAEFPGLGVEQGGVGREQTQDIASLGDALLIAVMVIYTMLASQLRSYIQPLIILSAIPFGAGGALIGHFLFGFDLSFISIFGIIALSGVVVNGSLVLVDRYNYLRRTTDLAPLAAIASATERRFRAIFLTTLTTALGLLPMLLETSIQAQFLVPMAVSLATGVLFSSMIILFIVPALVLLVEDLRELWERNRRSPGESARIG